MGIGIDIIDVPRIKNSLQKKGFKQKVFLCEEIEYCEQYANFEERYAGVFACKEAVMKACKFAGQYFLDIQVCHDLNGAPKIKFKGAMAQKFKSEKIDVSISHIQSVAVAIAIYND